MTGTGVAEDRVPAQVTLTADTMAVLERDPELMAGVQDAAECGGNAALIAYLDAHDLRWRAGGSTPAAAFADMVDLAPFVPARSDGDEAGQTARRKAARKAARRARRTSRRC